MNYMRKNKLIDHNIITNSLNNKKKKTTAELIFKMFTANYCRVGCNDAAT